VCACVRACVCVRVCIDQHTLMITEMYLVRNKKTPRRCVCVCVCTCVCVYVCVEECLVSRPNPEKQERGPILLSTCALELLGLEPKRR